MPRTALTLSVIFLLLAVGWRGLFQVRRTGDAGFRRPSQSAGLLERVAGGLIFIGGIALLLSPACALVGLAFPIRALDRSAVHVLGLVLARSGIGVTVLAEFQMGDSWRVGVEPSEETSLVQDGLFTCVRNPIYSGTLLFALGLFCLVPSVESATAGFIFASGIQLQVRGVEEPYLTRRHRQRYRQYARTAGRFVPRIGRIPWAYARLGKVVADVLTPCRARPW